MNDKIHSEVQQKLDNVWETIMAEYRTEKSHLFSSDKIVVCKLLIYRSFTAFHCNSGELAIEDNTSRHQELITEYGKKLFDEYMKILRSPECFRKFAPCYHAKHRRRHVSVP